MHDASTMETWPADRLLAAAAAGNEAAFAQYCKRSLPSVLHFAKHKCAEFGIPQSLARDFVQEAQMKALQFLRKRRTMGVEIQQLTRAWLNTITANVIIDYRRRTRHEPPLVTFDETAHVVLNRETEDRSEELRKFVDWLPDAQRELVQLILLRSFSIREAAEHLGMSADAVRQNYCRAVRRIQEFLEQHGDVRKKPENAAVT